MIRVIHRLGVLVRFWTYLMRCTRLDRGVLRLIERGEGVRLQRILSERSFIGSHAYDILVFLLSL
jgi:hypothetical protein